MEILKQPKYRAGILAVVVHVIFLIILIFGISWQNREPEGMLVELWDSSQPSSKVAKTPPPQPQTEPQPKPKVQPPPKQEIPKPQAKPPAKPDIALEARKKEEEQKREQEELLRQQREQAELTREREAQFATANQLIVKDYKNRIRSKIRRFIVLPPDAGDDPQAEFLVTLLPTGEVLHVEKTFSSGNAAYDSAVERALYKAQPLPLPPQPELFGQFRELQLKFRLHEEG